MATINVTIKPEVFMDAVMEGVRREIENLWSMKIHEVMNAAYDTWVDLAKNHITGSKLGMGKLQRDYISSLVAIRPDRFSAKVGLFAGRTIESSGLSGVSTSGSFYPLMWETGGSALGKQVFLTGGQESRVIPVGDGKGKAEYFMTVSQRYNRPAYNPAGYGIRSLVYQKLVQQIIPDTFADIGEVRISSSSTLV